MGKGFMKKILIFLLFGCLFSSLFSETSYSTKSQPSKVIIQIGPYIYGDLFQPGFGASIRTQVSGHTFELAPMVIPPSTGHFGCSTKKLGLICSYYYTFRRSKFFQPYLGCGYTHIRDLHRSTCWHYHGGEDEPYKVTKDPIDQENYISNLIGLQLCFPNNANARKLSGYLFVDVQGPVIFDKYGFNLDEFVCPRIGAGLQF